jgi:hypothetical protein
MKSLFYSIVLVLGIGLLTFNNSAYAYETKKVCKEKKDKSGKTVQECKTIKVHKKLETSKDKK